MIIARSFKEQTIAVFGLGRTGITAALSLQSGGAKVLAWDDSVKSREAAAQAGVTIADLNAADWTAIDELVLSPGVPHTLPAPHWVAAKAKAANVPIICDIEIFAREIAQVPESRRPKVIAITGTNGKSTTTSLIGHVLKTCGRDAQVGGNIGRGVLDLDSFHAGAFYVLELSSYQLELTQSLKANAAIFINLTPDHIDRHGDIAGYSKAKQRIFANQTHGDAVIIGVDNEATRRICTDLIARNGRRIIPVSARRALGRGVYALGRNIYDSTSGRAVHRVDLSKAFSLEGQHNAQNAAIAFAALTTFNLDPQAVARAIQSFPGLAHRMESIGMVGPVRYVNDSKATNADAARQALAAYRNIYWIAGGREKEGGIEDLKDLFPHIAHTYLIGEAAPGFRKTLKKAGAGHQISSTLRCAVMCATRDALASNEPDPIILLSPACASFDQYASFEARGDEFRDVAGEIIQLFEMAKAGEAA